MKNKSDKKQAKKIDASRELGRVKKLGTDFKAFISRGNVVDMAVGVIVGGAVTAFLFNAIGSETNQVWNLNWMEHLCVGGFCFGAVFMATDPVTSPRTNCGKYIFGFLIGVVAIIIRCMNPGYPEGMMLAILLMNLFAALIDHCFVQRNINKRLNRLNNK